MKMLNGKQAVLAGGYRSRCEIATVADPAVVGLSTVVGLRVLPLEVLATMRHNMMNAHTPFRELQLVQTRFARPSRPHIPDVDKIVSSLRSILFKDCFAVFDGTFRLQRLAA
jgi:hypothetical protein